MTPLEWVYFIAFTIIFNLILQTLAWKIGKAMAEKEAERRDPVSDDDSSES